MVSEDYHREVRARLTTERDRLQREVDALGEGINASNFQEDEGTDKMSMDPADDASELFEREKNLTVLNTLQISLADVDTALGRLDAGTYGICENCGKPIGQKRLEAMPSARYCIDCQSTLERTGQLPAA